MADLFFTCLIDEEEGEDEEKGMRYEVWTNEKLESGSEEGGKFVWRRGGDLPKGTKSVEFADMGTRSLSHLHQFTPSPVLSSSVSDGQIEMERLI